VPDNDAAITALRELGLNQLEAEVYVFLLSAAPMTAYRIAQNLAKPAANVYKAIEVLARKGAILLEDGENRLCRAVPANQFLKQAERDHKETLRAASEALAGAKPGPVDERVYRIESAAQVFEICRDMLARATKIAVIDAFPGALAKAEEPLRRALARGVQVFVEAYAPVDLPGASIAMVRFVQGVPEFWQSEQLNVIVDGREHLIALLSNDLGTVHQAVWSSSLYISCIHHAGRMCEHTLVRTMDAIDDGKNPQAVIGTLREHRFFLSEEVPGQRDLMERYVRPATKPKGKKK